MLLPISGKKAATSEERRPASKSRIGADFAALGIFLNY